MSECTNLEHPFLEKLREIKWQVIDKGHCKRENRCRNMGSRRRS